uniref:Uncharacterized protein n=1 Tax=Panagrolaimus sp. PS1159 TaxID=55785 RepID=A0AC35F834_9BILA
MAEELNKIDPREKAPQQNVTPGTGVPGETESDTILVPHRALQGSAMPAVVSTIFASSGDADLTPHVLKNVTHAFCYMHEIVDSAISNVTHAFCYMHEIVDFAISVPHTLRSAEKMANRGSKLWHSKNKQSDCPQQELYIFGVCKKWGFWD